MKIGDISFVIAGRCYNYQLWALLTIKKVTTKSLTILSS